MSLRLAAVYAHPDDDTYGIGGTLALHRGEVEYTLVVATSGEAGGIADPSLATKETLGAVREQEERAALEVLGFDGADVHFLRYPDGELADVPREELVSRVRVLLEGARPDVVVTFGPEGVTKHEDHIAISQAATEAFHAARAFVGEGFSRLFYNALPQSDVESFWKALREQGIDLGDPEGPFMPRGVPDHTITTRVDCSKVYETKMEAIRAHRTQIEEIAGLPEEIQRRFLGQECFVQAWPPVEERSGAVLYDILQGI